MNMLRISKINRELKRIATQVIRFPSFMWEYLFLNFIYDKMVSTEKIVHEGIKPIVGEIAIYLVYAPNGLQKSHHDTFVQLAIDNITPIVVSNLPLSTCDLDLLLEKSALVIERPNVGYDFGGYRDALLHLAPDLSKLDRLYILNDSVWMIGGSQSWFEQVRLLDCDFVGATMHYGINRVDPREFRNLHWEFTSKHANFHYASYALAINKNILCDKRFINFWSTFRISNDKKRTVKRGEIGLSKWVIKNGFSHCATCGDYKLDEEIKALDNKELNDLANRLIIPEDSSLLKQSALVLQGDYKTDRGRLERIQIILTAVSRQASVYVMPHFNISKRDFQFIKKSPLRLSRSGAKLTLEILKGLDNEIGRHAYDEALEIFANRDDA
jgi:lipopolysaccharide biosynthesis protein